MTARRVSLRHAPFGAAAALSLALHGAALGAVLWVGLGTAPEPIALETVPMVIVEAPATSDEPPAKATATPSQNAHVDPPTSTEPAQEAPVPAPEQTAAVSPTRQESEPAPQPVPAFAPPPPKPEAPAPQSREASAPPQPEPRPTQSAALPKDSEPEKIAPAAGRTAVTEKPPRYGVDGLANPSPAYPWLSRRAGEQGRVVVRVAVDASGDAGHVEIARSSGHARLDKAALAALREWKFRPARRGGQPVSGTVEVPVTFRLSGN